MTKEPLLSYKDVLEKLTDQECHLFLGNGFNRWLGIDTSYWAIFKRMTENDHWIYKDAKALVEETWEDLEKFIGRLIEDISDKNLFLIKYVSNKVKYDFMKAAHEIVKAEIKNIYTEKNQGIHLLLKNFKNYFTLNYDSFLYLLLLSFKLDNIQEKTIAFQPSIKFIEKDMDEAQNNIYTEIKATRTNGTLNINAWDGSSIFKSMDQLTKTHFTTEIKEYSKSNNKGWKVKDIDKVVSAILKEERNHKVLNNLNDGSKKISLFDDTIEFVFDPKSKLQNLYFLHGAFHIYKDGKQEKKITQSTNKALYDKLEEILNDEARDIVCVFQAENKIEEINKSEYLKKAYNKLHELSGSMVIIGCSLSDNDQHIFDQINKSKIDTLYISTRKKNYDINYKIAKEKFPTKKIMLFEAETISYELPHN